MIAVTVHAGDTLSAIAAQYGTSYQAIAAASGIANPNLIYAGQTVEIPSGGGSVSVKAVTPAWTPEPSSPSHTSYVAPSAGASSGGGLSDVPGVPSAFAACVAERESSNGANQAYNGGVYGIITASGINVNGQSIAAQKAAFSQLYAQDGTQPWAPSDGC